MCRTLRCEVLSNTSTFGNMLTYDPVTKGQTGVEGTQPVAQHPLLVIDDRPQHFLVLDLSGRDHNAAVHEVSDGVGQIFVCLSQEGLQTEHLREQKAFTPLNPEQYKLPFFIVLSHS